MKRIGFGYRRAKPTLIRQLTDRLQSELSATQEPNVIKKVKPIYKQWPQSAPGARKLVCNPFTIAVGNDRGDIPCVCPPFESQMKKKEN